MEDQGGGGSRRRKRSDQPPPTQDGAQAGPSAPTQAGQSPPPGSFGRQPPPPGDFGGPPPPPGGFGGPPPPPAGYGGPPPPPAGYGGPPPPPGGYGGPPPPPQPPSPPKWRPPPRIPPPPAAPTTSFDPGTGLYEPESFWQGCSRGIYNQATGEIFCRTPKSWVQILIYAVLYLTFLASFTLVCLYVSLVVIKKVVDFNEFENVKLQLLTYPEQGIGLTATPTSEGRVPLIWYKKGAKDDYEKYTRAIDKFLASTRRKREVSSLGPCGEYPYGYGEEPCVIVRINKQYNWAGKPLNSNSTTANSAPAEVQAWMKADRTKLWLQCSGYHSYDKEHIGKIKYYPDPPGFDASMFPLDVNKNSPLVAIQISEFTMGLSLAIECKLWYDTGPSTIDFMLYVAPGEKIAMNHVMA